MAKGNLSPRQKMINLMYLVFIAMLAMQIDQEIIRSYQDTNQSLTDSRTLAEGKNKIFSATLDQKAKNSPETFAAARDQYAGMQTSANDLVAFIESIKGQLKSEAGFDASKTDVEDNFAALNNTDAITKKFFKGGDAEIPSKTSEELKVKMAALQNYILQNFASNPELKSVVDRAKVNLAANDNLYKKKGKNWLQYKFYNQPLIAALSNLEVIQSEARNLQSDALSLMLKEKVDADIKFNSYEAIVAAPSVIIQGEPAEAKVFIGTYASSLPVTITGVDRVANGQGFKTLGAGTVGDNSFSGTVSFTDAKGKVNSLPFSHSYRVIAGAKEVAFESGALLSADKMNVLYRGLPNPISGSILGADNSQTSLSASGASVSKKGGGSWTVTPGAGATTTLTISGKGPKGQSISKQFTFRIKNVPPPVGQIRGESVVTLPASSIPNQSVSVAMPDFDFPVSFSVNNFMFKIPGRAGMMVNGSSLSAVAPLIKNLRSGDIAYIYNINASASGLGNQTIKKIPPVVINVQ